MSDDRLDQLDYYTLLGVEEHASSDEIRAAFHRFALRYHPDQHVGTGERRLARAEQIYRRGAEAYRVLLDPPSRREYDAGLSQGALRYVQETDGRSRPPGPSRRVPSMAPRARPLVQQAEASLRNGDAKAAVLSLKIALGHDPGNETIEARLEEAKAQAKMP